MDHVFVTGFPGFIARRLVGRLEAGRLTLLVEARMEAAARAAAPEGAEVVVGDIGDRRLGLSEGAWTELAASVTDVFHLAAIYSLAVPLEIAQRVNVEGTGNVVELCQAARRLRRLHYVSTAYVAGMRRGVVYEHELSLGQEFKNHYESTKFQAELWVREAMAAGLPATILRPAIVVGDARTGETQKFDGPYYLLRLISLCQRRGVPIPQIGRAEAPFNVVPVDFVVEAIVTAAADDDAAGHTLHLVDPEPITAHELMERLCDAYGAPQPAYRVPGQLVEQTLRLGPARELLAGTPRESIRYLNHPVRFDVRQARHVLERHGVHPPRFDAYADAMAAFFRAHEDDPAFAPAAPG